MTCTNDDNDDDYNYNNNNTMITESNGSTPTVPSIILRAHKKSP